MRHLWRIAIGNWSASPGRALAAVLSVAMGVGTVVTVTNFYETARRGITDEVVTHWLGSAHVAVHPVGAHWASLDASLADAIAELDNVRYVTTRLRRRARLVPLQDAERLLESTWWLVDAIGINPETEQHFRTLPNLQGRMIQTAERGVAVIERDTANRWEVGIGGSIMLTPYAGGPKMALKVVGLFDSQRVAEFQRPSVYVPLADLQELKNETGVASVIDIMLKRPSPDALATVKAAVERCIAERNLPYPYRVETAAARQLVLNEAERITQLLLMLIAFVSLLTSFFIILTTQSMSLLLRRPQLGIMRCVGLTRRQLTALISIELMPLGVVGTFLGILGGIAATRLVAFATEDVFIRVYLSPWGIRLAAVCGIATTLLSTLLLIVQVGRVTPLEAVNPHARPARMRYVYIVSALGVALLALHQWMVRTPEQTRWLHGGFAAVGAGSLHLGWVFLAPAVVVLLGRPIARLVGRLLGLRAKLAEDPFVRAPWRSTGACWVLMVGLSLIVYIAVRAEGVLAIWDFPARLPEAFVWSPKYVPGEVIERIRKLPGIGKTTVSTDVACDIETPNVGPRSIKDSIVEKFLSKLTKPVFVAGEPDELLSTIKIVFTEGSQEEAMKKLRRGGYVLIPPQTARNKKLHVGDRLTITIGHQTADFEVAGVVQSPALDLAVTAFQAESYMQFAAASAILGTRSDLKEKFGLDVVSMFMCDLDLSPTSPPSDFFRSPLPDYRDDRAVASVVVSWGESLPSERETIDRIRPALVAWQMAHNDTPPPKEVRDELRRFARAIQWVSRSSQTKGQTREESWMAFRERLLLLKIAEEMDRPDAIMGSLRRLKQQFDTSLKRAILVITWLPSIILAVAAIGIANLMMVSVHLRSRQIAVLRAVGAQKSQIIRLVLAEAITIGLLGSVMGVALGLHEAHSVNRIAAGLINVTLEFIVPVGTIALGVLLTVAVCLVAGIIPARYAARNNIIAAMQTT